MKRCRSKCAAIAALVVVAIAALSYVVMLLWNHVAVSLADGINAINYGQAVGLLILSRILFGGFRGRHGHHHKHCCDGAMTAEETEKVRCGLFSRFKSKQDDA
ncbi:hypothetical protein [Methylophilus methylotrophus]|uniref:hypothetical protein n=1 Tax=Methylophilus methylotrophus TaxID=17 RepID=UPI00037B4D07|nr:hypothetical protein [Methylophilus methylotrophus]